VRSVTFAGTDGHGVGRIAARAGSLRQDVGEWRRGTRYSATGPDLFLWIYATIIETTLNSYSAFVRPLEQSERAELYRESERFGQLYDVGEDIRPVSYQAFQDYYYAMLARVRFWGHYHVAVTRCRAAVPDLVP